MVGLIEISLAIQPSFLSLYQGYLWQYYVDVGLGNSTGRSLIRTNFTEDLESMQAFFGLEVISDVSGNCSMSCCMSFHTSNQLSLIITSALEKTS